MSDRAEIVAPERNVLRLLRLRRSWSTVAPATIPRAGPRRDRRIYTLRGLVIIAQVLQLATGAARGPVRYVVFSFVSLVIGLCYLAGTLGQWRSLREAHGQTGRVDP